MTYKIEKTAEEWKALLKAKGAEPLAYEVTRHEATERPYTGRLEDMHQQGMYLCVCCDKPLFTSETKFESGCGWPSYFAPLAPDAVETKEDGRLGMRRTEVHCPTAVPIWAMSSTTAHPLPACATASIRLRYTSRPHENPARLSPLRPVLCCLQAV